MRGRKICHPAIGAVAGATALGYRRHDRLRLLLRWGWVEFRRQSLRAGDDPRDVWVFAGSRGGICPAVLVFDPTSVFFLPLILSGLFLCPFLKARPRILAHYFTPEADFSRPSLGVCGLPFDGPRFEARVSLLVFVIQRLTCPEGDIIRPLILLGIVHSSSEELAPSEFAQGALGRPLSSRTGTPGLALAPRRRVRAKGPRRLVRPLCPLPWDRPARPASLGKRAWPGSSSLFPGACLIDHERPPLKHLLMKATNSLFRLGRIAELDKGKPSRLASLPVGKKPHGQRLPACREELHQLGLRHIIRQVSHEESNRHQSPY